MRAKLFGILAVTILEGIPVFAWLYFAWDESSLLVPAIGLLFVGEFLETAYVGSRLRPAPVPVGDPDGAIPHRRRLARTFGAATVIEIGLWLLWLGLWRLTDAPDWVAGAVLLVVMHLKHQLEAASIRDVSYLNGLLGWRGLLASVSETAGAVGGLLLLEQDEPVLAAVAFFAGLLIEHALLMTVLYRETAARDISLPRLRPPRMPLRYTLIVAGGVRFAAIWRVLQRFGPTSRLLNRSGIVEFASQMPARPNPLSTMADYTSWASLTNRKWSGRHLPPSVCRARTEPPVEAVAQLFLRADELKPCVSSTVLFTYFAQWFTDGFLRTERGKDVQVRNTQRNESTHDVDLTQLYGLDKKMTKALRLGTGGLLRSQQINGEEYPEYLCRHGKVRKRFKHKLLPPIGFKEMPRKQRNQLFAMGTDTRNLGFVAFNVLFLREHNRIARILAEEHAGDPAWDDKRLFATARNILIVVLLRITVEEYVNHITGLYVKLRLPPPKTLLREAWQRPNWMAIEFNLLYRWHSLTPGSFRLGDTDLTIEDTLANTHPLTSGGLRAFMVAASAQRAGRISLFNTDPLLVGVAETPSIMQARVARLRSYNDYRELCGLPRARHFGEFSTNPAVSARLKRLYDRVDDVEFYVGLFAEEAAPHKCLPPLMGVMVAFDAFTQVLTNPLVAPHVYGPQTFSATGMAIIEETSTIKQLVSRNVPQGADDCHISLRQRDYAGP